MEINHTPPDGLENMHRAGYRIGEFKIGGRLLLLLSFHDGTSSLPAIVGDGNPTLCDYAAEGAEALVARDRAFLQAVCRYRNSGGDMFDLERMMKRFCDATEYSGEHNLPDLRGLPDGVTLEAVCESIEREDLYLLKDGRYLRVIEDTYCEAVTPDELARSIEDDPDYAEKTAPLDILGGG